MTRKTLKGLCAAAALLLAVPAFSAGPAPAAKKHAAVKPAAVKPAAAKQEAAEQEPAAQEPGEPVKKASLSGLALTPVEKEIKIGSIEVYTPVNGITTAQETYDILSPFDGRVEEVQTELFAFVTPESVLGRLVSTEMAALLDSTSEGNKRQTERRWQDVYKYYEVKPLEQGVVTNIYTSPKTQVYKGDRLFTVAKKVIMIGKNTKPLYSILAREMTADIKHYRTAEEFKARLNNFIPLKDSIYYNRLWLEVLDLRTGIRIGEQFDGSLFVGSNSNTRLVPRKSLFEFNGRKYLFMEVETGLMTEEEAEILRPGSHFLEINNPAKETEDGKTTK